MADDLDIKSLKGLSQDSRSVKDGYLFAAFPGSKTDGRKYIEDAIRNGAHVIITPMGMDFIEGFEGKVIQAENPRAMFARIAAEFYGGQPQNIVAVTGTNGKTSVVHFTKQLWLARSYKATSLGTLTGAMTTPDTVTLHAQLADLAAAGITHLAMEASSHGLHQHRLDGAHVQVAGFTNLSRDHLDYHGDMKTYFESKNRLFTEILLQDGTAVLNADSEHFKALKSALEKQRPDVEIWSYGFRGETFKILSLDAHPNGQSIMLDIQDERRKVELPLVGAFQAMNALCALGMVLAQDPKGLETYLDALAKIKGAPGRLQLVDGHKEGAAVYVDYAHTPDALDNVLRALRPHTTGDLVCLFGCGGDRDRGKRPVMGRVASDLADRVIVTDDNPRSENPAEIRAQVMAGAAGAEEIECRRKAIKETIKTLKKGDVLVIAGKGHELGQVFAEHTEPFDDIEESMNAIKEL